MEIIATNLGEPTTFLWNGKEEETGIYKHPVPGPILLEKEAVSGDTISNRKVHGGVHKACYLYSADHYPYWKKLYPDLSWDWGMLGENLTVKGLDESQVCIGDVFEVGTAVVQVSQPREPCYKLGIRFGNQQVLKQFIDYGAPGAYVRVLQEGNVKVGDRFRLTEPSPNPLTVKQFFELLYAKEKDPDILRLAITNKALPERKRERLKKYL